MQIAVHRARSDRWQCRYVLTSGVFDSFKTQVGVMGIWPISLLQYCRPLAARAISSFIKIMAYNVSSKFGWHFRLRNSHLCFQRDRIGQDDSTPTREQCHNRYTRHLVIGPAYFFLKITRQCPQNDYPKVCAVHITVHSFAVSFLSARTVVYRQSSLRHTQRWL